MSKSGPEKEGSSKGEPEVGGELIDLEQESLSETDGDVHADRYDPDIKLEVGGESLLDEELEVLSGMREELVANHEWDDMRREQNLIKTKDDAKKVEQGREKTEQAKAKDEKEIADAKILWEHLEREKELQGGEKTAQEKAKENKEIADAKILWDHLEREKELQGREKTEKEKEKVEEEGEGAKEATDEAADAAEGENEESEGSDAVAEETQVTETALKEVTDTPKGFKKFWKGFKKKTGSIKVFGTPLPEFLVGLGAGAVVRGGTKALLSGAGGLVAPIVAGGVAGGVVGAIRRFGVEKRAYNDFVTKLEDKRTEASTLKELSSLIKNLEHDFKEEVNSKKREAVGDQLRYARLYARKEREGGRIDVIKELRESATGNELYATTREIMENIEKAKLVNRRKMAKAVLRGAIFGAIGGALGGFLIDQFFPDDVVPPDGGGILEPTPEPTLEPIPEPEPGVPSEGGEPVFMEPIPVPELPEMLDGIKLPEGSNPWREVEAYMEERLGRDILPQEILEATAMLAEDSDISVDIWGIDGSVSDRLLPTGTDLVMTRVNEYIISLK